VAERVRAGGYAAVIVSATATGKDLAPRIAARLGTISRRVPRFLVS